MHHYDPPFRNQNKNSRLDFYNKLEAGVHFLLFLFQVYTQGDSTSYTGD